MLLNMQEIDNYIRSNHTKQNNFLSKNDNFRHKLQKLIKSICKADVRDHTLPNFTETEFNLMKAFYKGKTTSHDMKYLMVEDVIFLNIMQKLSK